MTHLNELCAEDCLFDSSNPVDKKNACDHCWFSDVVFIHPMLRAIDAWGQEGHVIAEYKNSYFFRTLMENGKPSVSTLNKNKVKLV